MESNLSPASRAMSEGKFISTKEFLRVYSLLIKAAERCRTVNYKDIAAVMGIPTQGSYMGWQTSQMLKEISCRECDYGRPMISAIVVNSKSHAPGKGFFTLARELRRLQDDATNEEELAFWKDERDAVYSTWKNEQACSRNGTHCEVDSRP